MGCGWARGRGDGGRRRDGRGEGRQGVLYLAPQDPLVLVPLPYVSENSSLRCHER